MKKNKFYPLGGTTVFLVDQWAKHYVEKNLKMGEKRKLTEKLELRRIHNPGICLGDFAIGAGGVLWVLGSMFKKEGKEL